MFPFQMGWRNWRCSWTWPWTTWVMTQRKWTRCAICVQSSQVMHHSSSRQAAKWHFWTDVVRWQGTSRLIGSSLPSLWVNLVVLSDFCLLFVSRKHQEDLFWYENGAWGLMLLLLIWSMGYNYGPVFWFSFLCQCAVCYFMCIIICLQVCLSMSTLSHYY